MALTSILPVQFCIIWVFCVERYLAFLVGVFSLGLGVVGCDLYPVVSGMVRP